MTLFDKDTLCFMIQRIHVYKKFCRQDEINSKICLRFILSQMNYYSAKTLLPWGHSVRNQDVKTLTPPNLFGHSSVCNHFHQSVFIFWIISI